MPKTPLATPDSPLEPLFQALHVANPSFDLNTIDVVTDRNNMRKLLSFVDPTSNPYGVDPFAMTIEVVNNTAIFSRQETKTYEILGPNDFRGFGHEFETAYTKEQVPGSTGHHRIITYDFGGMKFILRHETDGYVAPKSRPGRRRTATIWPIWLLLSARSLLRRRTWVEL